MQDAFAFFYWTGFVVSTAVSYSKAAVVGDAIIHGLCSWGYIVYLYNLQHHVI